MFLPEFKCIVKSMSGIQKTRDMKHEYLEIVLTKPARKDEFGESIGNDDFFLVKAWNKKATELPGLVPGDRVNATLILQGGEGLDKESKIYHSLNLTLYKITKVE